MLTRITVEAALNAELADHLGFAKHQQSEASNSRNGTTSKTLQTEDGQFELDTPRDRAGSFEPQLVKKHQRRFILLFIWTALSLKSGKTRKWSTKRFTSLWALTWKATRNYWGCGYRRMRGPNSG